MDFVFVFICLCFFFNFIFFSIFNAQRSSTFCAAIKTWQKSILGLENSTFLCSLCGCEQQEKSLFVKMCFCATGRLCFSTCELFQAVCFSSVFCCNLTITTGSKICFTVYFMCFMSCLARFKQSDNG